MIKKLDKTINRFLFAVYAFTAIYTAFFDFKAKIFFGPMSLGIPTVLICVSIAVMFYLLCITKSVSDEVKASVYGFCSLALSIYYSYRSDLELFNLLAILILCSLALMRSVKGYDKIAEIILFIKFLQMIIVRSRIMFNRQELIPTIIVILAIFTIRFMLRRSKAMFDSLELKVQGNAELLKIVEIKRKDAKMAAKVKTDFLANMSHEIRTPMNAICGMTDLLLQTEMTEEQHVYLDTIKTSADNLLSIINDILDFSKIEAGKMELVEQNYNLLSQLNALQNTIDVRIGDKPLTFEIIMKRDMPTELHGDDVRVQQIMLNFLTNAVKYSERGSIKLILDYERIFDETILFKGSIVDTGIGIKKDDMDKLFEEFSQVDMARNHQIEGTGIGLTITDRLVKAMNGHISVESEYGVGSTFSFEIDQKVTDFDSVIDTDSQDEFISLSSSGLLKKLMNDRDGSGQIATFIAPDARVLVVDDNAANLLVARGLIGKYGVSIETCSSGQETLDLLEKDQNFDMLFVDHMMPGMDGVELVKTLRAKDGEFYRNVPIVALTANAIKGVSDLFLANGFWDYMSKPIDVKVLGRVMNDWIPPSKRVEKDCVVGGVDAEENALLINSYNIPHDVNAGIAKETVTQDNVEIVDVDSELKMALSNIPEMNFDNGLFLCGNDFDIYLSVVEIYVKSSGQIIERINAALATNDLQNYGIEVHGVKSSSRNIGAEALGELAYALEMESKAGNAAFVKEKHEEFMDAYTALLEKLSNALLVNNDDSAEELIEISQDEFVELLNGCIEALDSFDVNKASELIGKLSVGAFDDETRRKIKDAKTSVDLFDFDIATEILSGIKNQL